MRGRPELPEEDNYRTRQVHDGAMGDNDADQAGVVDRFRLDDEQEDA